MALSCMAGTAFFLAFQACGLLTVRPLLQRESGGVRLLLGSVLGSVMLQWFPIPFAFFLGFSRVAHLCALGLALVCPLLAQRLQGAGKQPGLRESLAAFSRRKFLWVILLVLLLFWFLVWHSFRYDNGRIYSSQATFGGMNMHLSFITSLARQGSFPPNYSILPFARLSYPFLCDSISASLYLWGPAEPSLQVGFLRWAYFLPMAFAGAQVLFGFYLFAARLLRSRKTAALAWTLFFGNGGFGFLYFLGSRQDFFRIFTDFYQTPTNFVEGNIRWVNVIVDMMLPQRATLFGWAVLFPTLYLLVRAVFDGERRYFLYAGVLAGLLPMIHTHSLLALALICGVWLLGELLRGLSLGRWGLLAGKGLVLLGLPLMWLLQYLFTLFGKLDSNGLLVFALVCAGLCVLLLLGLLVLNVRKGRGRELLLTWGVLLAAACFLAAPQLFYWTFGQADNGGFIRGHFGWSVGEENYLLFYLKNIGLAGLLALGGLLTANEERFRRYSPALAIWFLAEFISFQPNTYDNNKLLYVAYGLLCCCGAEFAMGLLQKLKSRGLRGMALGAAVSLCTFSAVLSVGRECNASYEIYGDGAIALADFVEKNTAPDSVILTDIRHNNEICSLAGRNVVCGSPTYLHYHGLPYAQSVWAVQQMYEKPEEFRDLFRENQVEYVLVSDFERSSYQVDETTLAAWFPKIYDDGVRRLYEVRF